jgi:hypothetical protein
MVSANAKNLKRAANKVYHGYRPWSNLGLGSAALRTAKNTVSMAGTVASGFLATAGMNYSLKNARLRHYMSDRVPSMISKAVGVAVTGSLNTLTGLSTTDNGFADTARGVMHYTGLNREEPNTNYEVSLGQYNKYYALVRDDPEDTLPVDVQKYHRNSYALPVIQSAVFLGTGALLYQHATRGTSTLADSEAYQAQTYHRDPTNPNLYLSNPVPGSAAQTRVNSHIGEDYGPYTVPGTNKQFSFNTAVPQAMWTSFKTTLGTAATTFEFTQEDGGMTAKEYNTAQIQYNKDVFENQFAREDVPDSNTEIAQPIRPAGSYEIEEQTYEEWEAAQGP